MPSVPGAAAGPEAADVALRRRHGSGNVLLFLTVLPITPLVDISLLLLCFFLLAGQATVHRDLPVTLPKAVKQCLVIRPCRIGLTHSRTDLLLPLGTSDPGRRKKVPEPIRDGRIAPCSPRRDG